MSLSRDRKTDRKTVYNRAWMKAYRKSHWAHVRTIERASQVRRAARLGAEGLKRENLRYNLWYQYRMPIEVFEQMVEAQHGACAICENGPALGKRLHVDHDHRTGKVRGLLCHSCNQGMIALDRVAAWPEKASRYATKFMEIRQSH